MCALQTKSNAHAFPFYLDINSAYRNRLLYPDVGNFVLEVNTNFANTPTTAQDPILLSFPYETNQCQGGSTTTQIALSVSSKNIIDYYKNSYLQLGTEFRQITSYDPTTQFATVSTPFSAAPPALTTYTIRYELPVTLAGGNYFDTTPFSAVNNNTIVLGPFTTPNVTQYTNMWVFVPGSSPPTSYEWKRLEGFFTGIVDITITNPGAGYATAPQVVITGDGQGAIATAIVAAGQVVGITIVSPGVGYTFANITFVGGGGLGATATATIGTLGMVAGVFNSPILAGSQYQILRFSYNNVVPLNFQKTNVYSNASIVQIKLVNLMLPNLPVNGSYFGTLQNYPFVYVCIYPEGQQSYSSVLITNAPSTIREKAVFKVPITYLQNNSFLTLSNTSMTQNISLKENDSLRIMILLPNGQPLDFVQLDSRVYPVPSDPFQQVSVYFELTHLGA